MKHLLPTLLALSLAFSGVALADPPAVQVETLLKAGSSWDGAPYATYPAGKPELSVLKITIPPHTALNWHSHPSPNAAYVASGNLTVQLKDTGQKMVISKGQVLPEVVGTIHRGMTGKSPVVLIVFYAGAVGLPLSQ
jgi:quercetin dioxygenase-like cupin family protein